MGLKQLPALLLDALKDLRRHNPLQLAASTSFFSLFALCPILLLVINVLGLFVRPELLSGELFDTLSSLFGQKTADALRAVLNNFSQLADNIWASVIAFVFFIFVATTLLGLVRSSINILWEVQVKPGKMWRRMFLFRAISFAVVLGSGVFFLITLLADGLLVLLVNLLPEGEPPFDVDFLQLINAILSVVFIAVWFALIFKILPNADIDWKPAFIGGFFTSLLFGLGKVVLNEILVNSNIRTLFGAFGSAALFLLFIFYSSLIFYFGATFTKHVAKAMGVPIQSGKHAVAIEGGNK